jgi:hypothetical protein
VESSAGRIPGHRRAKTHSNSVSYIFVVVAEELPKPLEFSPFAELDNDRKKHGG